MLLILLFMMLSATGACTTAQPTPTPPIDKPYLSSQEAIAIAQQQALNHHNSLVVRAAKSGSRGWSAKYTGSGKWGVDLRVKGASHYWPNDITIFRWTVFERNLTAVYVGAYKGN